MRATPSTKIGTPCAQICIPNSIPVPRSRDVALNFRLSAYLASFHVVKLYYCNQNLLIPTRLLNPGPGASLARAMLSRAHLVSRGNVARSIHYRSIIR